MRNVLKLVAVILFFQPFSILAEDDAGIDVLNKHISKQQEANSSKITDKVKGDINYTSIFSSRDGRVLNGWLGVSSFLFQRAASNASSGIAGEYFLLEQRYTRDGKRFSVNVYVPFPRRIPEAAFGLFDPYRKLEPVKEKLVVQENLKIQGKHDATLYEYKDHTCSLLVKMPKEVRVYISGQTADKKLVIELANELSFDRLKEKLTS